LTLGRRRKKKKEEQEEQEQEENRLNLLLHFAICNRFAIAFDPSTCVRKWAEETKELRPKEWRNEEDEEDDEDDEGSHHQSAKP
jgi:hypothetical protein